MRKEISRMEDEMKLAKRELVKIEIEWVGCLQNMLREGYYLNNGVSQILQELRNMQVVLNKNHLPTFLDEISKKTLLQYYSELKP